MATLTPELEQKLLDQLRRLPGEDVDVVARLVFALAAAPPPDSFADPEEAVEDRELAAMTRRVSQASLNRAWDGLEDDG